MTLFLGLFALLLIVLLVFVLILVILFASRLALLCCSLLSLIFSIFLFFFGSLLFCFLFLSQFSESCIQIIFPSLLCLLFIACLRLLLFLNGLLSLLRGLILFP